MRLQSVLAGIAAAAAPLPVLHAATPGDELGESIRARYLGQLPPFTAASGSCAHPLAFLFDGNCSRRQFLVDRLGPNRGGLGHTSSIINSGIKIALLHGLTYYCTEPVRYGHDVDSSMTRYLGLYSMCSGAAAKPSRNARVINLDIDTLGGSWELAADKNTIIEVDDTTRYRTVSAAIDWLAEQHRGSGADLVFVLQRGPNRNGQDQDLDYRLGGWLQRAAYWVANAERLRASLRHCVEDVVRVVVHWRAEKKGDSSELTRLRSLGSDYFSSVVDQVIRDIRAAGERRKVRVTVHRLYSADAASSKVCAAEGSLHCVLEKKSGASLPDLIDDMVTADVFVASRSTLSQWAAVLAKKGQVVVYVPFEASYCFMHNAVPVGVSNLNASRCARVLGMRGRVRYVPESHRLPVPADPVEALAVGRRDLYDSAAFRQLYAARHRPHLIPCNVVQWCTGARWGAWSPPPARGRLCDAGRLVAGAASLTAAAAWERLFECTSPL